MKALFKFYMWFREPRNFLIIVITFICMSITLHQLRGYDIDWGITNLVLSCEATIASAALMMLNKAIEKANDSMREMVVLLVEMSRQQNKLLQGVLLVAEAQRDSLEDHEELLKAMKRNDEQIIKALATSMPCQTSQTPAYSTQD